MSNHVLVKVVVFLSFLVNLLVFSFSLYLFSSQMLQVQKKVYRYLLCVVFLLTIFFATRYLNYFYDLFISISE